MIEHDDTGNLQLGERLRLARERADFTQAQAADVIKVARTTLLAIEQGRRPAKINEIQLLAFAYGTSANALLRREAPRIDLVPQFRRLSHSASEESMVAVQLLQDLVSAEIELESALGVLRTFSYPRETPILPGDISEQAEHDATELRRFLGIGNGPIFDLLGLLELQLGMRVYLRPIDSKISGLFAFEERAGACILLNSNHRPERLRLSAAHEAGHFVGSRRVPQLDSVDATHSSREERYANSFSFSFLMPAHAIKGLFSEITAGQSHLTRKHIIVMAHHFGVSREALVRRLENLKLVKAKTWDWFVDNGGISDSQALEVVGTRDSAFEPAQNLVGLLPRRLALLATEAFRRELYSEGQLSQLLSLDRHDLRSILRDASDDSLEGSDFVRIVH
jgi:Zn-dependent peptidase ImmA (M78 family)/transcriptional regulator with XRE-family HTH domain